MFLNLKNQKSRAFDLENPFKSKKIMFPKSMKMPLHQSPTSTDSTIGRNWYMKVTLVSNPSNFFQLNTLPSAPHLCVHHFTERLKHSFLLLLLCHNLLYSLVSVYLSLMVKSSPDRLITCTKELFQKRYILNKYEIADNSSLNN